MPNWCQNSGYVTLPKNASEKAREAFDKLRKNEAKEGWFANVLPCPPEMHLGLGSAMGRDDYMNIEWLRANSKFTGDFGTFKKHEYENGNSSVEFKPSKEYEEYLRDTYGNTNWYSWNVENYGVKWDVNPEIDETDDNSFHFAFDSAWGTPTEFFEHLANEYGLEFELQYIETGCAFAGLASYRDGKFSSEHAEGDEDYLVLAVTEFGEPIECIKSEVEEYKTYDEYVEAQGAPKNPKLVGILKDYYEAQAPSEPVKSTGAVRAAPAKKAAKKVPAKKAAVKKAAKKVTKKAVKKVSSKTK